jgi:hypothetical protein
MPTNIATTARIDQLEGHLEDVRINLAFAIAAGDREAYVGLKADFTATQRAIDLLTYE